MRLAFIADLVQALSAPTVVVADLVLIHQGLGLRVAISMDWLWNCVASLVCRCLGFIGHLVAARFLPSREVVPTEINWRVSKTYPAAVGLPRGRLAPTDISAGPSSDCLR